MFTLRLKVPNEKMNFYGIIFLRLKQTTIENTIRVLKTFMQLNITIDPMTIIVISDEKIRIRKPMA